MPEKETVSGMEFRSLNEKIKRILKRSAGDAVRLGYLLRRMMEERLWDGQYNCVDEYLETELHMDYTMANRFIGINKKYSVDGESADIDVKWEGYSQAVLIEMLSMPPELEEKITPDMTVRQVREVKRQAKKEAHQVEQKDTMTERLAFQTEHSNGVLVAGSDPAQDVDTFPGQVCVEEGLASVPEETPVWQSGEVLATVKSPPELPKQDGVLDVAYQELESAGDIATSQPGGGEVAGETEEPQLPEAAQERQDEDLPEIMDETAEVRRILKREQKTLDDYLAAGGLPEKTVFRQKTIVTALEAMLQAMENGDQEAGQKDQEPDQGQPPLPVLKNNTQRKEWLGTYKSWGLWYRDEHIGADFYKYDFDNGARLIVEVYQVEETEYCGAYISCYLHLVGGPKPPRGSSGAAKWQWHEKYSRYPNSDTELVEFLKELQKKGREDG